MMRTTRLMAPTTHPTVTPTSKAAMVASSHFGPVEVEVVGGAVKIAQNPTMSQPMPNQKTQSRCIGRSKTPR